ncbi:MAG: hypothetical protein CSA33_08855 [Desulfobulbus propionicus]|nr:MAG: hypothetical protein CSA33_08855 [Desulfobulbus propionicus]
MIAGLIEGKSPEELVWFARGPLKSKAQELLDSLDEPLGERHRLLLSTIHHHMGFLTEELPHIDESLGQECVQGTTKAREKEKTARANSDRLSH